MTPTEIQALRRDLKLSQHRFALRYRFALYNLANWEQGRRRPEPGSAMLLRLIAQNPTQIAAMIAALPRKDKTQ